MIRRVAIVLAAGLSRRFGSENKLLAEIDGQPVVQRVAETAARLPGLADVLVVTGHDGAKVEAALEGTGITLIENGDYEGGLSTSLTCGLRAAVGRDATHALILLGDMPFVDAAMIEKLIAASDEDPDAIIRAAHRDTPGNPVILPAACFQSVMQLAGDRGAKAVIESGDYPVIDVECGPDCLRDIDTPSDLDASR